MPRARKKAPSNPPSSTEAAVRVEKGEPVHARGLRDLVGIGFGIRQGEPYGAMRVDFELNCGSASLRVGVVDLELSLRTCFVALGRENCEVLTHTRYEHRLAPGSVEAKATETRDRSDGSEVGGGVDVAVAASPKPGILAKIFVKVGRTKKSSEQHRETVDRQPRIDLVVTAGQDRWQVGDPHHGDGRRSDRKLLGTYFNEERDGEGEPKPLCVVAGVNAGVPSMLTASALARFGQLLVHKGGAPAAPSVRSDAEAPLRRRSRKVQDDHRVAADELRARVAGLVVAKAMQKAQRDAGVPVEGEFVIARQSVAMGAPGQEPRRKDGDP